MIPVSADEAYHRAASALVTAEERAIVDRDGAEALVAVAGGWVDYAESLEATTRERRVTP